MALAVKQDVSPDPIDVAFFSARRVMFAPDRIAHLVEQLLRNEN